MGSICLNLSSREPIKYEKSPNPYFSWTISIVFLTKIIRSSRQTKWYKDKNSRSKIKDLEKLGISAVYIIKLLAMRNRREFLFKIGPIVARNISKFIILKNTHWPLPLIRPGASSKYLAEAFFNIEDQKTSSFKYENLEIS